MHVRLHNDVLIRRTIVRIVFRNVNFEPSEAVPNLVPAHREPVKLCIPAPYIYTRRSGWQLISPVFPDHFSDIPKQLSTIRLHPRGKQGYETRTGPQEAVAFSALSSRTAVKTGLRGGLIARYSALDPRVSRLMRATRPGSVDGSRSAASPATSS